MYQKYYTHMREINPQIYNWHTLLKYNPLTGKYLKSMKNALNTICGFDVV